MQLNIGCGFNKMIGDGWVNVDAFDVCKPDIVHDLNEIPWPFLDKSVDHILARHVFEHLVDWWGAFNECARVLKVGGTLDMRVPHDSSSTAMGYRDHLHVFTPDSFHGIHRKTAGQNAWAMTEIDSVPIEMVDYGLVPFEKYMWMTKWCPRLLAFCADHMRNFIWEQRFTFRRMNDK